MSESPERRVEACHATIHGSPGANPRQRGLLRSFAPFLAGALAAGWLLRAALPWPSIPARWAGLGLVGLAVGLLLHALHMRRRRMDFIRGAVGEEETARILGQLPSGIHVFHGLPLPNGDADVDHVVVSPSGLFVVETLNWSGRASIRDGHLLYDGREPDRNPVDQVRRAAAALREHLRRAGLTPSIHPVLCLPRDALAKDSEGVGGVIVCRRPALPAVLMESVDAPLDAATIDRLVKSLHPLTEEKP